MLNLASESPSTSNLHIKDNTYIKATLVTYSSCQALHVVSESWNTRAAANFNNNHNESRDRKKRSEGNTSAATKRVRYNFRGECDALCQAGHYVNERKVGKMQKFAT